MDAPESLNLAVLAALSQRVVDQYKERGIHEVTLTGKHLYQSVPTEDMFDLETDFAGAFPIGSLDDDLSELSNLLDDSTRCPTAVDMERLGNVLRAVSQVLAE
ncbi:hypothetical protein [Roseovarius sp.]